MPMTPETIKALNYIIDAHNDGSSDDIRADKFNCNVATIRSFLSLAKKLGTQIKRQPNGPGALSSPEAKAIMAEAMRDARRRISALSNGRG